MSRIHAPDRLMLALDVPDRPTAEELLDCLGDSVRIVKIGLELFTREGPAIVKCVQERGKAVFLDLKFFDINETVRRATAQVGDLGVQFLTVHAYRKTLEAAVEGKKGKEGLNILAVTVLTNFDEEDVKEDGSCLSMRELVTSRAKRAKDVGCDGVIASGQECRSIRQAVGRDFLLVTPGIRPVGTAIHDQARVTTPSQAIEQGADYLVVGRPIRDADDPRSEAKAVIAEMQSAFDRVSFA